MGNVTGLAKLNINRLQLSVRGYLFLSEKRENPSARGLE